MPLDNEVRRANTFGSRATSAPGQSKLALIKWTYGDQWQSVMQDFDFPPQVFDANVAMTVESSMSGTAIWSGFAYSDLTVESSLTASAIRIRIASASFSFESEMTAIAGAIFVADSSLTFESELTAGDPLRIASADVAMTSESDLAASALLVALAASNLSAESDTSATAIVIFLASSPLTSESSLSASALLTILVSSDLTSFSIMSVSAKLILIRFRFVTPVFFSWRWPEFEGSSHGYNQGNGISVLKKNGVYTERKNPSQTELAAADLYYLGGREYAVDTTESLALVAAGYSTTLIDNYEP